MYHLYANQPPVPNHPSPIISVTYGKYFLFAETQYKIYLNLSCLIVSYTSKGQGRPFNFKVTKAPKRSIYIRTHIHTNIHIYHCFFFIASATEGGEGIIRLHNVCTMSRQYKDKELSYVIPRITKPDCEFEMCMTVWQFAQKMHVWGVSGCYIKHESGIQDHFGKFWLRWLINSACLRDDIFET